MAARWCMRPTPLINVSQHSHRSMRRSRGYSSFADAAYAAVRAQVRRLALFHFDQDYSDDAVDQIYSRCRELLDSLGGRHIELIASREGSSVIL